MVIFHITHPKQQIIVYYYMIWLVFMWSLAMWSLNGNHIADTTFLNKIVSSVNLQKIHQINIKCVVCNNNTNKLLFNMSMENTFIVVGRYISLILQTCQISLHNNNSYVFHKQTGHLFVLVIIFTMYYPVNRHLCLISLFS